MRKIILLLLTIFNLFLSVACFGNNACFHEFELIYSKDATCIEKGINKYICSLCNELYTEELAPSGHIPGEEPTITSSQICTICSVELKKPVEYMLNRNKGLTINHYRGVSDDYFSTIVDSQYHGKYRYEKQYYSGNSSLPLVFEVPIQGFYTHTVLSDLSLKNVNNKYYETDSGFKVEFQIEEISTKFEELNAWSKGDLSKQFTDTNLLSIVRTYNCQSKDYNKIYEIIDFSNSYIEVSKLSVEGYKSLSKISGSDFNGLKNKAIQISDKNGRLFSDPGTYRVMFKYSMVWVSNPNSKVSLDIGSDEGFYPYGFINDQYDYFYIKITDKNTGILLPSNNLNNNEYFAQIRAKSNSNVAFLTNKVINFDEEILFNIDLDVDMTSNNKFYFNNKILNKIMLNVSYIDENMSNYKIIEIIDLYQFISEENVYGKSIEIELEKKEYYRSKQFKFEFKYSFYDDSGVEIEEGQVYEYLLDW